MKLELKEEYSAILNKPIFCVYQNGFYIKSVSSAEEGKDFIKNFKIQMLYPTKTIFVEEFEVKKED